MIMQGLTRKHACKQAVNIHEPVNDANPNLAAPLGPKSVAFREFMAAAP